MFTLLLVLATAQAPTTTVSTTVVREYVTIDKCEKAGAKLRKSFVGTKFTAITRCVGDEE